MADVRPFRGVRFNTPVAGDLSDLLCPPFDVISPEQQGTLYARSPYNVVRLELSKEEPGDTQGNDRYTRAAATQAQWLEEGVLKRDESPAMYMIEETFELAGRQHKRRGLLAAVRLEEFDKGVVLPHEYTRPGPKLDRLALMRAARSNYSPLMGLYRDSDGSIHKALESVAGEAPAESASPPELPSVKIWPISDGALLSAISDALSDAQIYLADGHHRYETAITYRNEARRERGVGPEDAVNFRMMSLMSIEDPGLLLLGYHRAIADATDEEISRFNDYVRRAFDLEEWSPPAGDAGLALEQELDSRPYSDIVYGFAGIEPGKVHIGTMKSPSKAADELEHSEYYRLHEEVLRSTWSDSRESEVVEFEHDAGELLDYAASGKVQVGIVMRGMPLPQFEEIVTKGQRLPSKSTFFHPKLPTGAVIQRLEGEL